MATILLSAAGAAIGAGFGGTVLGLSGAVIGRAIGATVGNVIDQRILGSGSATVETGRIDRFRIMGASEGGAIPRLWGRQRLSGQVIWSTRFVEHKRSSTTSGGKGGGSRQTTVSYSYSISFALALCEGEITRIGRIWADGAEIEPRSLNMRLYRGTEDQLPDPRIEAVEGAGMAPAYRGLAYVVIEDMDVSAYGSRVPQLTFEVVRRVPGAADLAGSVSAVCLIPGCGEYALSTTPVNYRVGVGQSLTANMNSTSGQSDFATSLQQLREELPNVGAATLVVSWFGDDLRCGECNLRPKVERVEREGRPQIWRAGGIGRGQAQTVPWLNDRPLYGGTPADDSVVEAIRAIKAGGQEVTFYPFILMEQLAGNGRPDPWSGAPDQPALPWRGRITLSTAPGREGTPDQTAAASAQVAQFFGTAGVGDFSQVGGGLVYTGPDEWSYRRFILHYAHLCARAGGVDAFCIGSEMRALTQIRGQGGTFPAVAALRQLAADVRAILGSATKISYAADWSEYFGYHADGNVYFHLDPLWADTNIDFVGIDNYLPLSDWREGDSHADASWGAIYDPAYLKANIEGGEYYDWYYDGDEAAALQIRTPITDGAYDEPWVFRAKDIRNWWANPHHERIAGVRAASPTGWVPGSKAVRFTEYGCAAIDKGTNQPNLFMDPKSSESALPRGSNGRRDDLIQMRYLQAMAEYWRDARNNPVSPAYGGAMIDFDRCHVWSWDTRPYPEFPAYADLWGDAANYMRGHWLNGRTSNQPLEAVAGEICTDVVATELGGLHGLVRGYGLAQIDTARSALQPLMQAYGIEAAEREGALRFRLRDGQVTAAVDPGDFAISDELPGGIEYVRSAEAETTGRLRLSYIEADGDFAARVAEAIFPDDATGSISQSELALVLTPAEASGAAEGWLAQARVARDGVRFALPPSASALGSGDVVAIGDQRYRIDRVERTDMLSIDAVRVEPGTYRPIQDADMPSVRRPTVAVVPVEPIFLDLPLLRGDEVPYAPHVAIAADPWPGTVAIWHSDQDEGYSLNRIVEAGATIGVTESDMFAVGPGRWDEGAALRVRVVGGALSSVTRLQVLNGENAAVIGDGSAANWEVFQFAEAELVAPSIYELRGRLRGQSGTDGLVPSIWPAGSTIVFLDAQVQQLALSSNVRGLARWYRTGLASRGFDDQQVDTRIETFDGAGLRPYPVCHLRAVKQGGDLSLSWVRRTRIDGDSWQSTEVPLGEDREVYRAQVFRNGVLVRTADVTAPNWTYSAALQALDGGGGPIRLSVAQMSDRFGAGPARELDVMLPL